MLTYADVCWRMLIQPTRASSTPQEMRKSEADAAAKGAEGLIEVSRKTFQEVAMDESKDVVNSVYLLY